MKRIVVAMFVMSIALAAAAQAQSGESSYKVVEKWATFPEGVTAWSAATGVDIDPRNGNIYVFHRNEAMPIMAFDKHGKFLRAWGQGMFKTTHFLRTDREGNVWVTDRGDHQVFKFSPEGKLLMTLGRKGVVGENESTDAFNGVADLVIAKNGDIFIADGESTNTRVVKYSRTGNSSAGGAARERSLGSSTSRTASRSIRTGGSTSAIAGTSACRSLIRRASSSRSGTTWARHGASSSRVIGCMSSTAPTRTAS